MRALTTFLAVCTVIGCDDDKTATLPDMGRGDAADMAGTRADGEVDRADDGVLDPDDGVEPDDGVGGPDDGVVDPDDGIEPDDGVDPDDGIRPDGGVERDAQGPDGPPPATPVARAVDELVLDEDDSAELVLDGIGGEGALNVAIVEWPASGALSTEAGALDPEAPGALAAPTTLTYTPAPNYFGRDTLTFGVEDEAGQSSEAVRVRILVEPVNDEPVAIDDEAETDEDVPVDIPVLDNDSDVEGDVSILRVTQPDNGLVRPGFEGDINYEPELGFAGEDVFTYTVRDRDGAEATATVTVTVNEINDPPVPVLPPAVFTDEDVSVGIALSGIDQEDEEDALRIEVRGLPEHGRLDVAGGPAPLALEFVPAPDFNGGDQLTFVVIDSGGAESEPVDVLINVAPVNDPPVANDDATNTPEEVRASLRVVANDTDVDNDVRDLIVVRVGEAENGRTEIGPNDLQTVTYTPDDGFAGVDSFTYLVRDPEGGEDEATVTITVAGENDPPSVVPIEPQEMDEDGALRLVLTGTDEEEPIENLTIRIIGPPGSGRLELPDDDRAPRAATYRPNPDYHGDDAFTFEVIDGAGEVSEPALVRIRVRPVNDPPIARDDFARTDTLTPVLIDIQANDTDVDDPILRVVDVTEPPFGRVESRGDGRLEYTPRHPDAGEVRFSYTLEDGSGEQATAEVVVDVALADVVAVVRFDAGPATITEGRTTTLTWETAFAASCAIEPDVGEVFAQGGDLDLQPEETTEYRITCEGPGGPAVGVARVVVLLDGDRDGISTEREIELGYLPDNPDSDGDGLLDGLEDLDQDGEVDADETGVLDADTDDDGLLDGFEDANRNGRVDDGETDPRDPDSDDDGLCDFVREDNDGDGIDPEDDCEAPVAAVAIVGFSAEPRIPLRGDPTTLRWRTIAAARCDIQPGVGEVAVPQGSVEVVPDGVTTYVLRCTGPGPDAVAELRVEPDSDVDGDGIPDLREEELGYDPNLRDTDADGLDDGVEDPNHDGLSNGETSAIDPDSDRDLLLDGVEDANGDRIRQPDETDPLDRDTDADGIADGLEDANHDGVRDAGETNPLDRDSDDDSLPDGIEDANQNGVVDDGETDPRDPDSDDDGRCDALRVDNEANGLDVDDACVGSEDYEGIWFVDAAHVGPANGLFWDSAFTTPALAVAVARPGDQIWVAAGRYRPLQAGQPVLPLLEGLEAYGGFEGDELALEDRIEPLLPTVLDGDMAGDGRDETDARHVVILSSGARLDGFIVTNGHRPAVDGGGGGLFAANAEDVLVVRTVIRGNLANFGGGALVEGGSARFEDVLFEANTGTGGGGGLFVDDGATVTLERVRFERNRSVGTGGGATVEGLSSLTGSSVRFIGNQAAQPGGGLALESGAVVTLVDASFEENTTEVSGGGASAEADSTLEGEQLEFARNRATISGGGLGAEDDSNATITAATFIGNVAGEDGGGVSAEDGAGVALIEVLMVGNRAGRGGATFCAVTSSLALQASALRENEAVVDGGGVYGEEEADVTFEQVHIVGNRAVVGGGVFAASSQLSGGDVVLSNNTATEEGGGLALVEDATVTLTNITVSANRSVFGGGIRVLEGTVLELNNPTFADNFAETGGGLQVDDESEVLINNIAAFGNVPEVVAVDDEEEFTVELYGGCADQDLEFFDAEDVVLLEGDPFVRAVSGEAFLDQDGPCVDTGDEGLVVDAFANLGIDWRERTTDRAARALDEGPIDAGHHFDPQGTWISALDAVDAVTIVYLVNGVDGCVLVNDGAHETERIEPGAGLVQHQEPAGTVFTMFCGGAVATVEVP